MAFLELKNIYKSYYLDKEEFPVLKGINLQFDRGEFVSIGVRRWVISISPIT